LGIFLHWGHASSRGWELSWQLTGGVAGQPPSREAVGCDEYFANAATFDPVDFDAEQWADRIQAAGARYVVFTAKHHDGFAMFDTQHSDYSITRTAPFARDVVAELLPALRRRGLRIGLYFSIVDWHHPDYPRYTDDAISKPYVLGHYPRAGEDAWHRYRQFMLGQLSELLTDYGPIDICWLDGEFEHSAAEWDFAAIRAHIRTVQPHCLVNDRCVGYGDFATPEQELPEHPIDGPWESCLTMNDSWGWVGDDDNWKSSHELVERLVETVSAGGNLLLNVGPRGDGRFPAEAIERLDAIGQWMAVNSEAVYDVAPGLAPGQCRLPTSRSDDGRIYVYLTLRPVQRLLVRRIPVRRIRSVRWLGGATASWSASPSLADLHRGDPDPNGELSIDVTGAPDSLCPVLAIDFDVPRP
jgi:alpha-L-fucosidase